MKSSILDVFSTVGTLTGFVGGLAGFIAFMLSPMNDSPTADETESISRAATLAATAVFPQALFVAVVVALHAPGK